MHTVFCPISGGDPALLGIRRSENNFPGLSSSEDAKKISPAQNSAGVNNA
jgi:hypothetical protein